MQETPSPSLSSIVKRPRVLLVAAALVVLIVVLIAACGGGDDDQAASSEPTTAESINTIEDLPPDPDPPAEVTPEPATVETVETADLPLVKVKGKALKRGLENNRVKQLQRALIYLCYLEEGADDGQYGAKTKKSVQAFQLEMGLNGDGVAGQKTIRVVNRSVKAAPGTCEPGSAPSSSDSGGGSGDGTGDGSGDGSGDGNTDTETDPG